MSNHDDELNRLLDALAGGEIDPHAELDPESGAVARRFMTYAQIHHPSAEFSDRLGAMLAHVQPVPALAGRRIEHVGDGIGLVASMPMPRRFSLARYAAIAAIALLMIALGGFYRSGSDNGGNLIFAPVASASPAPGIDCPTAQEAQATYEANRPSQVLPFLLDFYGIRRAVPGSPGNFTYVWPESLLPRGANADVATLSEIEQSLRQDLFCGGDEAGPFAGIVDLQIRWSAVLEDGRVGLLVTMDLLGTPTNYYFVYRQGPSRWYPTEWYETLPDEQLADSATIHAQDNWRIQFYELSGAQSGDTASVVSVGYASNEIRVHANRKATIDVQNVGTVVGRFQIPEAGIDQTLEPGATTTVSVTLATGWHRFTTTIDGVAGGGFIYAEPLAESAIVPASDCNQVDIGFAAMDNLVSRNNTSFDSIVVRHAPNDPNGNYGVIAYEDLPLGNAPDDALSEAIHSAVLNDAACTAAGIKSVVPTVWEYHAILQAEAQGTPRAALATATVAPAGPGSTSAAVPDILEIRQLDDKTVGVLTAERDGDLGLQNFQYYSLTGDTWVWMNAIFVAPAGWIAATTPGTPTNTLSGDVWDQGFTTYEPASTYFPYQAIVPGNQPIAFDLSNPTDATVSLKIEGSDESITLSPGKSATRSITLPPGTYRLAMYADDVLIGRGFLYVTSPPPASATPAN